MDYRDNVFLSVAENLNFSKAANDLFISQPAVTKHIKELESKLSVTLFERKGNKVYLTQAGKLTYNYLKNIKQQYNELDFELGRLKNTFKGNLKIGASSTISQYLIPEVLAAFYKQYPEIKLYLYNGNSFEMEKSLLQNNIDLALVENYSSQANIKYKDFLNDEIVTITGSNSVYSKKASLTISDFKQIPIVLRENGSGTLEVIKQKLQQNKININKLNIFIHLGSTEAIKNFLSDFNGIALVSEKSILKEIQLKTIKIIKVKNLSLNRKFRIATRYGELPNTAKIFNDFLINYNF